MNAVAKIKSGEVVPMAEAASLMEVISRAASDPNTDVSKLERLMAMYERISDRGAKAAYFAALSEMQDELPSIEERGEIKIGNGPGQKYALWEDVNKAIKPILTKHRFALSFRTGLLEGKITVTGVLSHGAGHSEETTIHLPSDTSGSKNAVQAVGSSTSYGKRYTAAALLNLTSGGEDDDGEGDGGAHANPQAHAIHGARTMRKDDDDVTEGVKNWCDKEKHFLNNCVTVADVTQWQELRANELDRLKRKAPAAWSDLIKYSEARITTINSKG